MKKPGITNYVVLGFFFTQKQEEIWKSQRIVYMLNAVLLLF